MFNHVLGDELGAATAPADVRVNDADPWRAPVARLVSNQIRIVVDSRRPAGAAART